MSIVLLYVFLLPVVETHCRPRYDKEPTFKRPKLAHVAFNLVLFPPLFFFSGLYYTDILSVFSVVTTLIAYDAGSPLLVIQRGLVSLAFRQTNIFWVAIYLGGKEVFRGLKKNNLDRELPHNASFADVARHSWERGQLYDPAVREARFEGWFYGVDPSKEDADRPERLSEMYSLARHYRSVAASKSCCACPSICYTSGSFRSIRNFEWRCCLRSETLLDQIIRSLTHARR